MDRTLNISGSNVKNEEWNLKKEVIPRISGSEKGFTFPKEKVICEFIFMATICFVVLRQRKVYSFNPWNFQKVPEIIHRVFHLIRD